MAKLTLDDDIERVITVRRDRVGSRSAKTVFRRDEDEDEDADDRIKHVVVIRRDADGRILTRTRLDDRPERKGQSTLLRPLEGRLRRLMRKRAKIAQIYLAKHERSNARKRNGWARDLVGNLITAYRKAR